MTRIIVKNLPKSINAEKLKQTFSQKGQVTDLQLKYTADGRFRHFAFVGFKTDEEADAALKFFDNTFVGASKIKVERCQNLGEGGPKLSKKKGQNKAEGTDSKTTEVNQREGENETKEDPEFAEFMKLHSKSGEKKIWSNDIISETSGKSTEIASNEAKTTNIMETKEEDKDEEENEEKEANKKEISDLDYIKSKMVSDGNEAVPETKHKVKKPIMEFLTVKVKGFSYQAKKKDVKQFFAPVKPQSIRLPPKVKGVAYVGFATEKEWKQALNKNRSFHAGHRIFVTPYTKKKMQDAELGGETKKDRWQKQESELASEESVAESGRIFIRNLAYSVTNEDLEAHFGKFGPLAEIHLPVDKFSRKLKGFAFVTFVMPEHASQAYTELDGTAFQGRMLHLLPAKSKPNEDDQNEEEGTSYKKKKQKDLKSQAGSSHNWNTLFLGANAVANLMAERYDTSKQQILSDNSKQSVAVRLALGETQLVAETKNFLEENGVVLKAFDASTSAQRSKNIILVKNLESGTNVDDIRRVFEPHGQLGRVLLPPNGVTAIVEFLEPAEAKVAFRKLAYSKFKNIPLYLEWAPVGVFSRDATPLPRTTTPTAEQKETEEDLPEPEEDTTLFVKNLNFATTDESLKSHFQKCGKIYSASVARKKDPKNPGEYLSMGYGFVQYLFKRDADSALKELQNSTLDEHTLELKRSNRITREAETSVKPTARKQTVAAPKAAKEAVSGKILVRNIPFEARANEVADLFKTFGELKAVRLPKKTAGTGSHRGFAFVEFLTKEDAKKAFEALKLSTHLYGRRLVLEWASSEETVEDVRRRTAAHFSEGPSAKRSKTGISDYLSQLPEDSI